MIREALDWLEDAVFGKMRQIKKYEGDGFFGCQYRFTDIGVNNYGGEITFSFDYATINGDEVVFHDIWKNGVKLEKKVIPKRFVRMDELYEVDAINESKSESSSSSSTGSSTKNQSLLF